MAVAHLDHEHVRRLRPVAVAPRVRIVHPAPPAPRPRVSRRALALAAVLAGGMLQHALVTTPLEPQPASLAVPAFSAAPDTAPATHGIASPSGRARHVAVFLPARPARLAHAAHADHDAHPPARVVAHPSAPARSGLSPRLPPVGATGDGARMAVAPNLGGDIMHAPSVSVAAIRAALAAAGSPTLGATYADHKDAAEYIWDSGRVLGVDPAVLMAIFHHESVFGTQGMARQTLSIGNIRPLAGQAQVNGYRLYGSWQEGIDDCYRLLRSYAANGATTVPLAIPVWAPPTDNNDDSAYIASVLGTMGSLYSASARAS